ncbi:MAG: hypothetical protein N2971_03175 [Chlorobi bacterium]|nr:hypothetical protein [Chlorobiota bacterium]
MSECRAAVEAPNKWVQLCVHPRFGIVSTQCDILQVVEPNSAISPNILSASVFITVHPAGMQRTTFFVVKQFMW